MSEAKERPILFNGPMVCAVLDGRKTVTRRALSARSLKEIGCGVQLGECHELPVDGKVHPNDASYYAELCPFGLPGDRLWVRETFGLQVRRYGGGTGEHIVYRATNPDAIYCRSAEGKEYPVKWKPSIHMPRHSCRILLEITDVRVEPLQHITIGQICKEGLARSMYEFIPVTQAFDAFAELWSSTGGDWDANPWVWVVEFKRIEP
ncbi:hypothetical protein D3C77_398560 [compost metagenome]